MYDGLGVQQRNDMGIALSSETERDLRQAPLCLSQKRQLQS